MHTLVVDTRFGLCDWAGCAAKRANPYPYGRIADRPQTCEFYYSTRDFNDARDTVLKLKSQLRMSFRVSFHEVLPSVDKSFASGSGLGVKLPNFVGYSKMLLGILSICLFYRYHVS